MMKILLSLLAIAVIVLAGCERKDIYQPKKIDFGNIAPFTSYQVAVKEGYVSIVTRGDDTLAITGIPMTITVAKHFSGVIAKSGDEIVLSYSNDPKFAGYKDRGTTQSDCVLMFEDTRNGDDDYNDLILWIHKEENRTYYPDYKVSCKFTIYPIALGAMKNFKLGFENEKKQEFIIMENCREELFDGKGGFINTEARTEPYVYEGKVINSEEWKYDNTWVTTINWFIETDTERMYIAETDKAVNQLNMEKYGNEKGRPFGIALPTTANSIFQYGGPFYTTERTPIQKLYKNFEDWLTGAWVYPLNAGGGKGVNNTDPDVCYNTSIPR